MGPAAAAWKIASDDPSLLINHSLSISLLTKLHHLVPQDQGELTAIIAPDGLRSLKLELWGTNVAISETPNLKLVPIQQHLKIYSQQAVDEAISIINSINNHITPLS